MTWGQSGHRVGPDELTHRPPSRPPDADIGSGGGAAGLPAHQRHGGVSPGAGASPGPIAGAGVGNVLCWRLGFQNLGVLRN